MKGYNILYNKLKNILLDKVNDGLEIKDHASNCKTIIDIFEDVNSMISNNLICKNNNQKKVAPSHTFIHEYQKYAVNKIISLIETIDKKSNDNI